MDAVVLSARTVGEALDADDAEELVRRAVHLCRAAGCFDAVHVCDALPGFTDGADGPARPPEAATSLAPLAPLVAAALRVPGRPAPEAVMLVNSLAALLSEQTLRHAVATFAAEGGAPVVSVEAPRDHPCQIYSFCRVAGFGFAPLLEAGDKAIVSARFPFKWALRRGHDLPQGALLRETAGMAGIAYEPASAGEAPYLWEKTSEETARIHVAPDVYARLARLGRENETLAAIGLDAERPFGDVLLFLVDDGRFRLTMVSLARLATGGRISAVPVVAGSPRPDLSRMAAIAESGPCQMFLRLESPATAVNYAILENVEDGPGIAKTPFFTETSLWRFDRRGVAHNKQNGACISGRQEFPEVFALHAAFLACRLSRAGDVSRQLREAGAAYAVVPERESLVVRSQRDMLLALLEDGAPDD